MNHGIVTEDVRGAFTVADWPERRRGVNFTLAGSGVPFSIGGGFLYFIGSDDGPIKIGFSVNPKARLRQLQHASPYDLRILATIPEGQDLEAHYHRCFAAHRLRGEWFTRCPEIEAEIARLNEVAL